MPYFILLYTLTPCINFGGDALLRDKNLFCFLFLIPNLLLKKLIEYYEILNAYYVGILFHFHIHDLGKAGPFKVPHLSSS